MRSGGSILVDQLLVQGVRTVFTVPGESFLPALDALRDCAAITTVVCRHEGGAAMMAEASARLTGRPGVALVTRAPGAANAMSGLVCATASAAPLLLIVGLTRSGFEGRDAFQEIDVGAVFGPLAKWTGVCRDTARIPEFVARACRAALAGRPGPVVLGMPEDVLAAASDVADAARCDPPAATPDAASLAAVLDALARAQRPLLIAGGPGWTASACAGLEAFAGRWDLPVAAAFRCQDAFDNRHPCYVGHTGIATAPKLAAGMRSADLLILAGCRADEITTGGWSLIAAPEPTQRIVAIVREPAEAGRLVRSDLALLATPETLAAALAGAPTPPDAAPHTSPRAWAAWRRDLRSAHEDARTQDRHPLAAMMRQLSDRLPDDAMICSGAGDYAAHLHRHFQFKSPLTALAPPSGSMGYGLAAAIAAQITCPDRMTVVLAGDGCFMMTGQELSTAIQYGLSLLVVIVDNGCYGTIRRHQQNRFPGRAFATQLVNPDFTALFASFGAWGVRVETAAQFSAALDAALRRTGVRLITIAEADTA